MKVEGNAHGWEIAYGIFSGARAVMLFVIIALIGTGWAFLKPFLSDNDKKIFLVVIPLQIIANIALLVIEDLDLDIEPSTQATWVKKKK